MADPMRDALAYFHAFRPLHVGPSVPQREGLTWLIEALKLSPVDEKGKAALALYEQFLASDHVLSRSSCVTDYTHRDWKRMSLYAANNMSPPLEARMDIFRDCSTRISQDAFDGETEAPDYLLQVSCTGYDSPTAAQKVIHQKGWGNFTKTLHLGHMGCYAALPASFLAAELVRAKKTEATASVLLIELCTLHLRPSGAELQQVVMNTLFADGAIRLDVSREKKSPSLALLHYHEAILPDSEDEMTWRLKDSAFAMTLSRAVPILIARTIQTFVDDFLSKVDLQQKDISHFAIHPGGPKIIELIAERLNLSPEQTQHSRKVFRTRGNMSSATVPHIWDEMLNDPQVPDGALILSMAFGPGLTIAANLLRKETK